MLGNSNVCANLKNLEIGGAEQDFEAFNNLSD